MKDYYILGHLGLGDHILCNGLVRHYAEIKERVKIPCYYHNQEAVTFMFKDAKNIEVFSVKDDAEAALLCHKKDTLRLGYNSMDDFDVTKFDQEFYRHAKVPFENRWMKFRVDFTMKSSALKDFKFIHDDPARGFVIPDKLIMNNGMAVYRPTKQYPFWDHISFLIQASEVHCINSSFLCLADSIPDIPGQRLFLHHHARKTDYPTLKRKWEIV